MEVMRVRIPIEFNNCRLTCSTITAAFWLAPLAMDTVIFVLTMTKSMQYIRRNKHRVVSFVLMYFVGCRIELDDTL
jgi:hypothetical protein